MVNLILTKLYSPFMVLKLVLCYIYKENVSAGNNMLPYFTCSLLDITLVIQIGSIFVWMSSRNIAQAI